MTDDDLMADAIEYADMIGETRPERQRFVTRGGMPRLVTDPVFIGEMYKTMTPEQVIDYELGTDEVRLP